MIITYNIVTHQVDLLATQLKAVAGYFDKIRVLNSNFKTDRIKQVVSRFKDVEYYERAFDNPGGLFRHLFSKAEPNEWFMLASYDELPSIPLLENLYNDIDACIKSGSNCIFYQLTNIIEYHPLVSDFNQKINLFYALKDRAIGEEFGISAPSNVWFGVRLFKNDGKISIGNSVHEAVCGRIGSYYSPYPFFHYKRFDGFALSALWQPLCDEENVTKVPNKIRDELLQCVAESGIQRNAESIYEHLKEGKISQSLKDWIWKYKDDESTYAWVWFVIYYFEFHPEQLPVDFWDSKLLNKWKESMLIGYQKLGVMETRLHPLMKRMFLKKGIKEISQGVSL